MESDIFLLLKWWSVIFSIGIIFFPISSLIFKNFHDKGYVFAKTLGIIFLTYVVFVLGVAHLLSFSQITIFGVIIFFIAVNFFIIFWKKGRLELEASNAKKFFKGINLKLLVFEELLFFLAFLFWVYVRGHNPSINGLEKFMDFGFVNSILRTEYFPPKDMWFAPETINYYYFGHLATALLTKISSISASVTYNLMIATIFAFAFTSAFSIGSQFFKDTRGRVVGGVLSGILLAFSGNLHVLYAFFETYKPETPQPFWELSFMPSTFPNNYWYPNATRFIVNTIHEFPIYSFVVSDLHGHVLSIPFVLLTVALLLSVFLRKELNTWSVMLLSFLVSVLYMTNAMDAVVYGLLSCVVLAFIIFSRLDFKYAKKSKTFLIFKTNISGFKNLKQLGVSFFVYLAILICGFIVFAFPFNIYFEPFTSGIGVLCAPDFLTQKGSFGPFLFEANHCQRSPWWQLLTIYGLFLFFSLSLFIFYLRSKKYVLNKIDYFVSIIILYSFFLLMIPEFIYAKDIYPQHYRANTMFKLSYQAFMMLSIASSYSAVRVLKSTKNIIFFVVSVILIGVVVLYSWLAITSFYGDLDNYHGIDGLEYMRNRLPDDFEVIEYLNKNESGQGVIVEAQGDSYTDFARISANTGLVNILGWTVHEWLWRGSYEDVAPRIDEVRKIYESDKLSAVMPIIDKYNVKYIYFGDLERTKYPGINEGKFAESGKFETVFRSGDSKLYKREGNYR